MPAAMSATRTRIPQGFRMCDFNLPPMPGRYPRLLDQSTMGHGGKSRQGSVEKD
jgi:hypothetical protein